MTRNTSLSIIVPVFNEQFLVQASLSRLRVLGGSSLLSRIKTVVVDDCSSDQTPSVLEHFQESLGDEDWGDKFEWKFIRHQRNQGKGASLRTGLEQADTELTVFHDADLEYHPRDLLKMIPLFLEQDADAVFGSRFLPSEFKRALFYRHSLGNRLITFLCDLVCDLNLTDIETCYKMVRTELLRSIPLESSDFRIEPELTIKLAKRGASLFEVPISYSGRTYQEGKKIDWRDGVRALGAILKFAISDRIYTRDEHGSEILARLGRAPRFTSWMADAVRPFVGDRVLEIGAGIGNLTVNLIPRSVYWATDINPLYLNDQRHLSQSRPYLQTAMTDVTRPESFPLNQRFDTVICLNVVEHLEDDKAALKNIYDVLEEGGRAIILVPQGPRLFGSLDETLGHHRRYTREQLIAAGERAGFRTLEVNGFNKAGVPAWWFNGRILRRKTFGLWQIKLLNLLVPLFRRLERWLPSQPLSLIAVFEKGVNLGRPGS
ncbi:MAG: glycosyl transferase family 2 [Acidobacteria bacterium]|nr:MAG: glycosyl transferase family 2 [Acidobacteriota bacterium]